MCGGFVLPHDGNLAVAASSWGGVLVRVGTELAEELAATPLARRPKMGLRTMAGWLHVEADDVRSDDDLRAWVERGASFAATLPPKKRT
jgi:hypothetical protein